MKQTLYYEDEAAHEAARRLVAKGHKVTMTPVVYSGRLPKFHEPDDLLSVIVKVDGEEFLVDVERDCHGKLVASPGPSILYRLEFE